MNKTVSIRIILLTALLFLMIFPLVVMTLITYHKENEIFQSQVSGLIKQSVEQIKAAMDTNLNEIDRLTWSMLYRQKQDFIRESLDTNYQHIEANRRFKEKVYMDLFSAKLNHIHMISFVTPNGYVLSTNSSLNHFNQLDADNFAYLVEQFEHEPLKMHWFNKSKAIYRPKVGFDSPVQASVSAARKVVDSNTAELQGYIVIQLNDLFLDEYMSKVQIGSTGSFQITDRYNEVVYRQPSALFDAPNISAAIAQLPPEGSGSQIVDNKWLLAYDNSEVSEWKLTAVVPLEEVLGPNQAILRTLLIMAGLGAIVSLIISFLFTNVISKPIIGLSKVMTMASMNNLHLRETVSSIQEISILQRNFNRLMDRIQQLMKDNEQAQQQRGDAQLKTLQMQIQPHFLYNTLDTIYWMSKKHKAEPISKLVTALGRFFRFTLSSSMERVTLRQELEHVDNYMRILSFRYRDKLSYDIDVEPGLEDVLIMPLILQPLVENAIEHGIAKLKGGGTINVSVYSSQQDVYLVIANDGDSINLELMYRLLEKGDGGDHVGLQNVHQRIKLSFGLNYGIQDIRTLENRTYIQVCIPMQRRTDQAN